MLTVNVPNDGHIVLNVNVKCKYTKWWAYCETVDADEDIEKAVLSQIPSGQPTMNFLLIKTKTTTTVLCLFTPFCLFSPCKSSPYHHCFPQYFLLCINSKQSLNRDFSSNQTTTTIIALVKKSWLQLTCAHAHSSSFFSSENLSLCPTAINVGEQFGGFKGNYKACQDDQCNCSTVHQASGLQVKIFIKVCYT